MKRRLSGYGPGVGEMKVIRYLKGSHISVDDNPAAIRTLKKKMGLPRTHPL